MQFFLRISGVRGCCRMVPSNRCAGERWKGWARVVAFALTGIALEAVPLVSGRYPITVSGQPLVIPYVGSHPLDTPQPHVSQLVLAIHSSSYLPQDAYNAVVNAKGTHAGAADSVCIFAPQFLEPAELPATIPADLLYWSTFPFRGTSTARWGPLVPVQSVSISVFEVVDRILTTLSATTLFPNLRSIVVVGHSAGGQLVNRYAAAGRFQNTLAPEREIHLRYLVLAPSSYFYFSTDRDRTGSGSFAPLTAAEIAACPGVNQYPYGFDSLFNYPSATGAATMRAQYPKRFVFHLVGSADNDPNHSSLSTDCESMAQGTQRVVRMQTYFRHLQNYFGPSILRRQTMDIVPGVGHSYSGLLNSAAGRRVLFNVDPLDTDKDGQPDWEEWIAGTNAANASDQFAVTWQRPTNPDGHELVWPVTPGRRYRVLRSNALGTPFVEVHSLTFSDEVTVGRWSFTIGTEPVFYRIQVELQ